MIDLFCLDEKSEKRRNWTEDETNTFIQVWSDYYPRLTRGGSRHTAIYASMAIELDNMLKTRSLTGAEVKMKIGNLTTEYRKKKKEQGRTGASPCTWPYFDSIDKLLGKIIFLKRCLNLSNTYLICVLFTILGERPYMDDTLLSDSMKLEQEAPENNDLLSIPDLNATQVSKQATDEIQLVTNSDDMCSTAEMDSNNVPNISNTNSVTNSIPSTETDSKEKKSSCSKKKRVSNPK